MFSRSTRVGAFVALIAAGGEVIADYPDDKPHPSGLLLGFIDGGPVHVVVAKDDRKETCYVVTVYVPDSNLWSNDFRERKQP